MARPHRARGPSHGLLSARFGVPHLDTGLLYRAVGWQVAANGGDPDAADDALTGCAFDDATLENPDLRSENVGGLASRVSIHPAVRAALLERQRSFARQPGGAVLDGRDIGTVIAPDAGVKLFVVATVEARAQRRFAEMQDRGIATTLAEIADNLRRRDARDTGRKDAPLIAAPDAVTIDTSVLDRDAAIARAVEAVEAAGARG